MENKVNKSESESKSEYKKRKYCEKSKQKGNKIEWLKTKQKQLWNSKNKIK